MSRSLVAVLSASLLLTSSSCSSEVAPLNNRSPLTSETQDGGVAQEDAARPLLLPKRLAAAGNLLKTTGRTPTDAGAPERTTDAAMSDDATPTDGGHKEGSEGVACAGSYWLMSATRTSFLEIEPMLTEADGFRGTATSGVHIDDIEGWCEPGGLDEQHAIEFRVLRDGDELSDYSGTYMTSSSARHTTIAGTVSLSDQSSHEHDDAFDAFSMGSEADTNLADVETARRLRERLIAFIWGDDGFPFQREVDEQVQDVEFPEATGLADQLARVDRLVVDMGEGLVSTAYRFVPREPLNRLVLFHQGHADRMMSRGGEQLFGELLSAGYDVVALWMPGMGPNDWGLSHRQVVMKPTSANQGHGLRYFLEPVAATLNHLSAKPVDAGRVDWEEVAMVGLSGGGWTTTVYAALDPRVRASFPVAGSIPLGQRTRLASVGDGEQWHVPFFRLASYVDLYVLGALEPDRVQIQILNSHDSCCFKAPEMPSFASVPPAALASIAADGTETGRYQLRIDEGQVEHAISQRSVEQFILPELR